MLLRRTSRYRFYWTIRSLCVSVSLLVTNVRESQTVIIIMNNTHGHTLTYSFTCLNMETKIGRKFWQCTARAKHRCDNVISFSSIRKTAKILNCNNNFTNCCCFARWIHTAFQYFLNLLFTPRSKATSALYVRIDCGRETSATCIVLVFLPELRVVLSTA